MFMLAQSITDTRIDWPSWSQWLRVLSLQDYNTRVVVTGTTLLGIAAGAIGTFMLLRKRSLMGDALSHATLPGIAIAFIFMVLAGGSGRHMGGLLGGAVITGVLGVLVVLAIRRVTRLKEDAAMAIVLSVFFGLGVAVLGLVQKMKTGNAAGLESFIYGKTASMLAGEAQAIAFTAGVVIVMCVLFYKELKVLCFDHEFAGSEGYSVLLLDLLMMSLVVVVTVIGLQAVGIILVIALLIIPAAAARFWTNRLSLMLLIACVLGALSGYMGATLSALVPRLPAGAIIVVVASAFFFLSMLAGPARGLLRRAYDHWSLSRKVARDHLLRAVYEELESSGESNLRTPVSTAALLQERSWSSVQLRHLLGRLEREGLLRPHGRNIALTDRGVREAQRTVRNHRLWEMFLITHADIAPSHVDRGADMIEHALGHELVGRLEELLKAQGAAIPPSPHVLPSSSRTGAGGKA